MKNAIALLLLLGSTSLLTITPSHADTTPDPSASTAKSEKGKKAKKASGLLAKMRSKQAKKQQPAYVRALQRNELFR